MTLPHYFRSARKKHGLSQKQMAILLGFHSHASISMLEKGKHLPSLDIILKYCLLFNLKINDLIPHYCRSLQTLLIQHLEQHPHLFPRKRVLKQIQNNLQQGVLTQYSMNQQPSVLCIYPTSEGFSFCFFESQSKLVDWGNIKATPQTFKKQAAAILDDFKPDFLVCEDNASESFVRKKTHKETLDQLYELAKKIPDMTLKKYSRFFINGVFEVFDANNRYQRIDLIVDWLPELEKYKPEKPKQWEGKHRRGYLFDAVCYVLAHYYVSACEEDAR